MVTIFGIVAVTLGREGPSDFLRSWKPNMPTYDYVCDACQYRFELFQGIKDSVKRKCPKCAKPKLRRLIGGGAGFLFKGSGFYVTDYRSDSYKRGADAEKKASEPKDKSTDTGKDKGGSKSSDKS
jgi:putative FmdB family regulatory protein